MEPLDDLLIARRRGTLPADAEPRLRAALRRSPELELSLAAGVAFDAQSTELAGDAALIDQIAAQVAQRWQREQPPRPPARVRWSIFSLVLGALAAVAGYRSFASKDVALRERAAASGSAALAAQPVTAQPVTAQPVTAQPVTAQPVTAQPAAPADPESSRSALAQAPSAPAAPSTPAASQGSPLSQAELGQGEPERGPAAAPAEHAPGAGQASRLSNAYLLAPPARGRAHAAPSARPAAAAARVARSIDAAELASPVASPVRAPSGSAQGRELSARELFDLAGQARAHDWLKAQALYTALIEQYPSAREAGIAEMALAKRALAEGRGAEALRWFVAHQARSGSSLRLEALWGEARALELLGRDAELERAWQRLVREYPGSAYAAVARRHLAR